MSRPVINFAIASTKRYEILLWKFVTSNRHGTKEATMNALTAFYLPLALLEDTEQVHKSEEIAKMAINCLSDMHGQMALIARHLQYRGIYLDPQILMSLGLLGSVVASSQTTQIPLPTPTLTPPPPVKNEEDDDDYDWNVEASPEILAFKQQSEDEAEEIARRKEAK